MNTTIRGHNFGLRAAMALLAVLLLLAVALAVQQVATTSDRAGNPAIHATSAGGSGASSSVHDPYVDRHAEVVSRYQK